MRKYRYLTCDVFTSARFGGNPLAVLPDAAGLSGEEMQKIAREFNYSESTFVTAAARPDARNVRIFTPASEVPFAGHPNVGTAFALASDGGLGDLGDGITVTFHETAGDVPVSIGWDEQGRLYCELEAPQSLTKGAAAGVAQVSACLSLDPGDILTSTHPPVEADVGLPFLVVELASLDALERATPDIGRIQALRDAGITPDLHLYVRADDGFDIRARMFAPLYGVLEDPATGSANCALAALLTDCDRVYEEGGSWRIAQGVEMGRPSVLEARTSRDGDRIRTWIGGNCVSIAEGQLWID